MGFYYAIGSLVPAIFLVFHFVFNFSLISVLFFFLCYLWPFALVMPETKERALSRKYRFAFLGLSYKGYLLIQRLYSGPYCSAVARNTLPLVFSSLIYLLLREGNLLSVFVGALGFELFYAISVRFKLLEE